MVAVAGLFSGIGGFELGFSQVGMETAFLAEKDPAARTVLKKRFPHVDLQEDVLEILCLPAETNIVAAGFPCQNLSMAGDKSGIEGPKSRVVRALFSLIEASRPSLVVIENVYFMLQLDSGRAMHWMAETFERLGYSWAYRVLNSMAFGLPQRRRRVYFIASLDLDPRCVLFADESAGAGGSFPSIDKPVGFYWTEGRSGLGLTEDGIPPLKVGSSIGVPSPPAVLFTDGEVLSPSLEVCEKLQGFEAGWTEGAVDPGSKREARWRLVGNSVSVPVARWIAERIKAPGKVLNLEARDWTSDRKWPEAAWCVGGLRQQVLAGDSPVSSPRVPISSLRDGSWNRLSARALDGFVSRVIEGGLRTPTGFVDRLRSAPTK